MADRGRGSREVRRMLLRLTWPTGEIHRPALFRLRWGGGREVESPLRSSRRGLPTSYHRRRPPLRIPSRRVRADGQFSALVTWGMVAAL